MPAGRNEPHGDAPTGRSGGTIAPEIPIANPVTSGDAPGMRFDRSSDGQHHLPGLACTRGVCRPFDTEQTFDEAGFGEDPVTMGSTVVLAAARSSAATMSLAVHMCWDCVGTEGWSSVAAQCRSPATTSQ